MIATSAPLLGKIREKGSTFYTISSALNDLDKTQLDSHYAMAPSKFVCLNMPMWRRPANDQTLFEEPSNIGTPDTTDPNVIVPKMIQNYIENALALSHNERTDESLSTIAESLFWKMMVKMGAMKVKEDGIISSNNKTYSVFREDTSAFTGSYNNLITYASDINVLNHITKVGQSYTEIFLHVPTQAAKVEKITFINPDFTTNLEVFPESGGPQYTVGLEDHPEDNTVAVYDNISKQYDFTPDNKLGIYFDELTNTDNNKTTKDFEFNVILVYYDIWNRNDLTTKRTNLYGILFLDKFTDSGAGSYTIDTLNKYVPNDVATGNGYGIRLSLKTTSNQDQNSSEVSINDYNTVSMELYLTALQRLNDITSLYESAVKDLLTVKPQIQALTSLLSRIETNDSLQLQITELARQVSTAQNEYRISNDDLFAIFKSTNEALSTSNKNVNIQQVVGNYQYDASDNLPIVLGKDGSKWKWNPTTLKWDKML